MSKEIGDRLAQARAARSLSLEKVSQDTYIRLHYLQALESGDLDILPSSAQARGFLRAYASYLGLDIDPLLTKLVSVEDQKDDTPTLPPPPPDGETLKQVAESAAAILEEIGQGLQDQRELLGFSLEDVERHTHLRTFFLAALEGGRLKDLPSPVQGRGMLKNYCHFLGLDPDPLLLRFAEGLQAEHAARQAARKPPPPSRGITFPRWLRRLVSGDLVFGGLLILGLVVFFIWAAVRVTSLRSAQADEPTAPPFGEAILLTPSTTPTQATPSPTPTNAANPAGQPPTALPESLETPLPAGGQAAVQVNVVVQQRAWMRVIVDGQVEFEGRLVPGTAFQFAGEERVEVLTGNGAALRVFYNQQDLGELGILGEVIERIFTAEGVATPTATTTPTETATPRTTPTPAVTSTPTPDQEPPPGP